VYNEQRAIFQELKDSRDKLKAELHSLEAAHDPMKRRLAEANKKSHGLSQEILRTVLLMNCHFHKA